MNTAIGTKLEAVWDGGQLVFPQMERRLYRALSNGGGVQTSWLLATAAHGEREPYDAAFMADTGDEPEAVWEHYRRMQALVAAAPYPIPMYVVRKAGMILSESAVTLKTSRHGNRYLKTHIPAFVKKPDGSRGRLQKQCTTDWKINVVNQAVRRRAKVPRGCKTPWVEMTIGISIDEWHRVAANKQPWAVSAHPLCDEGVTREECAQRFFERFGWRPPKSGCRGCPMTGDAGWRRLKTTSPEEFSKAVDLDYLLRERAAMQTGKAKLSGPVFLHSSLLPLDQVDFGDAPDLEHEDCKGSCFT